MNKTDKPKIRAIAKAFLILQNQSYTARGISEFINAYDFGLKRGVTAQELATDLDYCIKGCGAKSIRKDIEIVTVNGKRRYQYKKREE